MSYFNADQQDWMRYLASLPASKKCKCGWELRGKCHNPSCKRAEAESREGASQDGK